MVENTSYARIMDHNSVARGRETWRQAVFTDSCESRIAEVSFPCLRRLSAPGTSNAKNLLPHAFTMICQEQRCERYLGAKMRNYEIVNLEYLMEEIGEDKAVALLADYSCPNPDVEHYLRHTAVPFIKQGLAKTHLVYTKYQGARVLVGYFTIANKMLSIRKSVKLSSNMKKRIRRFAVNMYDTGQYIIYAPLIAQLGKNFTNGYNHLITGDELLQMACDKVMQIQFIGGGKIAYLECENIPSLLRFYERNGFVEFDKKPVRRSDAQDFRTKEYVQMMKYFG